MPWVRFPIFGEERGQLISMELDDQQNMSVTISPGDLRFFLGGLVSTPVDFENVPLVENRSAVASDLFVYPQVTASYATPGNADLFARGVRLGYTPLSVETRAVNADESLGQTISSVEVALDPNVVLTPVQVYVAHSCSFPDYDGLGRVEGALALWDQVPVFSETDTVEGGLLMETNRTRWTTFGPATLNANTTWETQPVQEYDVQAAAGSDYLTPDSVWRDCGVQFRLVRFGSFETDDSYNVSGHRICPGYTGFPAPDRATDVCQDLELQLEDQVPGLENIPTLIVVDGPLPGANGVTLVSTQGTDAPVSCVPRRLLAQQVFAAAVAHEVGHWSGLQDCVPPQGPDCELMDSDNPLPPPTDYECGKMRTWAVAANNNGSRSVDWREYWAPATCTPAYKCLHKLGP